MELKIKRSQKLEAKTMRKISILLLLAFIFILCPSWLLASEVCPLEGKVFSTSINGTEYQLSNFECGFGPGCGGSCILWYGNFESGPIFHYPAGLPFLCSHDGSIMIAGWPCAIEGNTLKCLLIPGNYECIKIGTKSWCVEKGTSILDFSSVTE